MREQNVLDFWRCKCFISKVSLKSFVPPISFRITAATAISHNLFLTTGWDTALLTGQHVWKKWKKKKKTELTSRWTCTRNPHRYRKDSQTEANTDVLLSSSTELSLKGTLVDFASMGPFLPFSAFLYFLHIRKCLSGMIMCVSALTTKWCYAYVTRNVQVYWSFPSLPTIRE